MAKQEYCVGCRSDFYNHRTGFDGATKCWSLKDAKVVTRYRIGWWTVPTQPGAFTKVKTLSCHHAPGQYGLYEQLPACAVPSKNRAAPKEKAPQVMA